MSKVRPRAGTKGVKPHEYPAWVVMKNTYPGFEIVGDVYEDETVARRAADLFQAQNNDKGETDFSVHMLGEDIYVGRSGGL